MKRLAIGVIVAVLSLVSVAAEATSFTFQYDAPGDGGGPGACGAFSTASTFPSTTCTGLGITTTVSADASLSALKLYLDSGGTFPAGPEPFTEARVRVTDTLTVAGGTGSGTLVFNWAVDGTLQAGDGFFAAVDLSQGGVSFAGYIACGADVVSSLCSASPETVNETRSKSIPFVFGTPLTVTWTLSAAIGDVCNFDNSCNRSETVTGSGTVDFAHTLQLQPLVILDNSGTPIGGASALSTSGFSYAVAPAASTVPEPASLLLLGAGLAAVVARRQFSKRK
jgi:hypothetical protein